MDALDSFRLNTPETREGELSFSKADKDSVHIWVQALLKANLGEMAKQIFQALKELNQIRLQPALRCDLLEQIRPSVHYITQQLRQHSLKQCIDLNTQQSRIASLIQTLYNQLITGYKLCVDESIVNSEGKRLPLALHRAITDSSYQLLLSFRLYRSPPDSLWSETHKLYQIAAAHKLADRSIADTANIHIKELTIAQCYMRCLLLHTSSPSQLRPRQIRYIFEALEFWVSTAEISREPEKCTFVIPAGSDCGPEYTSLRSAPSADDTGLNTNALAKELNAAANDKNATSLTIPENINPLIINHICLTLENNRARQHKRRVANGGVEIVAGITAAHYHLTGSVEFEKFTIADQQAQTSVEKTEFKEQTNDIWADVHDAEPTEKRMPGSETPLQFDSDTTTQPASNDYPVHSANIINISPSGYCVGWEAGLPPQITNGEMVGVREDANDNWNLAIVRWIKVEPGKQTLTGIELMAPNARPAAAAMLHKTQDSSRFMRCFVLPESRALKQAASVIMPSLPFQAGCKILLQDQGEVNRAHLNDCILSTASVNRLTYKSLLQPARVEPSSPSEKPGDDIKNVSAPATDDDKWTLL